MHLHYRRRRSRRRIDDKEPKNSNMLEDFLTLIRMTKDEKGLAFFKGLLL
jgi:hypothetical protein